MYHGISAYMKTIYCLFCEIFYCYHNTLHDFPIFAKLYSCTKGPGAGKYTVIGNKCLPTIFLYLIKNKYGTVNLFIFMVISFLILPMVDIFVMVNFHTQKLASTFSSIVCTTSVFRFSMWSCI